MLHELLPSFLVTMFFILEFVFPIEAEDNADFLVCGIVKTASNKTLSLIKDVNLTPEEFENVHIQKMKGAQFYPLEEKECVIKVCGYTWTEKVLEDSKYRTRKYGNCQIITKGDQSEISSNIYNDLFNVTSISCGCRIRENEVASHQGKNHCNKTCHERRNEKVAWKGNQCAILYEESNCGECWFKSVLLGDGESYKTDNSHYISTMVIREKCNVEQSFPAKEKEFSRFIGGRIIYHRERSSDTDKDSFKWKFSAFKCSCEVPLNEMKDGMPSSSLTTYMAAISTPKSFEPSTLSVKNDSCGYIKPANFYAIRLFENSVIDSKEFENLQFGKLENALFVPGVSWVDEQKCVLEICGFNSDAMTPYKEGTCEWFSGSSPVKAPPNIYKGLYEVSSVACSCRTNSTNSCSETCEAKNATKVWNGKECAMMFQEKDCQSCYFRPIVLLLQNEFPSLNSFQFKSLIIRPGCRIEKVTNGVVWMDIQWTYSFADVISNASPTFHKDSENFTCFCSPEVVAQMVSENTTMLTTSNMASENTKVPSTTDYTNDGTNSTLKALTTTQAVILSVGIVIVFATGIILSKRTINKRRRMRTTTNIKSSSACDDDLTNTSGQQLCDVIMINNLKGQSVKANVNKSMACPENKADYYLPPSKFEINCNNVSHEIPSDSQLKMEIMDEVKKMMESFLSSSGIGHDEIEFLGKSSSHVDTAEVIDPGRDNDFVLLLEKFQHVCSPNHIIARGAFSVPRKNLETPLGTGISGLVYKGLLRQEPDRLQQVVALKKLQWPCSINMIQSFLREINIFECIGDGNENIVEFLGACCHTDGLYLLTSFCELGSLKQYFFKEMRPRIFPQNEDPMVDIGNGYFDVDRAAEGKPPEQSELSPDDLLQLLLWCEQTSSGMEYLSQTGIVHVDLAIRNILLTADKTVKICDFGLSRKCLSREDCARTLLTGDFPFNSFAPECNIDNIHEPRKVFMTQDIWAFGCTLYEMYTLGDSLYPDVSVQGIHKFLQVRKLLLENYRHPKPPLAPDFVGEILTKCWNQVPEARPNFTFLKEFFADKRKGLLLQTTPDS